MEKHIFLRTLCGGLIFFAFSLAKTPAQTPTAGSIEANAGQFQARSGSPAWDNLSITGRDAKINVMVRRIRFYAAVVGRLPLGGFHPQKTGLASLRQAAFAPGTMEQLLEKFQGQIFIGEPSGELAQSFDMTGNGSFVPGLCLGLGWGKRLEFQASGQYFKTEWSGNFPVTVLPFQHSQPHTEQGTLNASASGLIAETNLVFFFSGGTIRPYVKAGARGIIITRSESSAGIGGVAFPIEIRPVETALGPVGGSGARVVFLKNGFADAGVSYGKMPGSGYSISVEVCAGWSF